MVVVMMDNDSDTNVDKIAWLPGFSEGGTQEQLHQGIGSGWLLNDNI